MDGLIEFPLLTGSGPQGNVLNEIIVKILNGMKRFDQLWNENTSRGGNGMSEIKQLNLNELVNEIC